MAQVLARYDCDDEDRAVGILDVYDEQRLVGVVQTAIATPHGLQTLVQCLFREVPDHIRLFQDVTDGGLVVLFNQLIARIFVSLSRKHRALYVAQLAGIERPAVFVQAASEIAERLHAQELEVLLPRVQDALDDCCRRWRFQCGTGLYNGLVSLLAFYCRRRAPDYKRVEGVLRACSRMYDAFDEHARRACIKIPFITADLNHRAYWAHCGAARAHNTHGQYPARIVRMVRAKTQSMQREYSQAAGADSVARYMHLFGDMAQQHYISFHPFKHSITLQFENIHRDRLPEELLSFYLSYGSKRHINQKLALSDLWLYFCQSRFRVSFHGEEGVDDGGLRAEVFPLAIKQMVTRPSSFMFVRLGGFYYPNALITRLYSPEYCKRVYEFFGVCIGICLLNQFIIDSYFPDVFYELVFGKGRTAYTAQELETHYNQIDPEFLTNLNKAHALGQLSLLEMYFVDQAWVYDCVQLLPLVKNGDSIKVTQHNFQDYKKKLLEHRLASTSLRTLMSHIGDGVRMVIDEYKIQSLSLHQLKFFLLGAEYADLVDYLEKIAQYELPYNKNSAVCVWLFQILRELSREQLKQFMLFMYSQVNISRFDTNNRFCIIRNANARGYPVAHTCDRSLDLPEYTSKEELREKLTKCIEYNEGFGLR